MSLLSSEGITNFYTKASKVNNMNRFGWSSAILYEIYLNNIYGK